MKLKLNKKESKYLKKIIKQSDLKDKYGFVNRIEHDKIFKNLISGINNITINDNGYREWVNSITNNATENKQESDDEPYTKQWLLDNGFEETCLGVDHIIERGETGFMSLGYSCEIMYLGINNTVTQNEIDIELPNIKTKKQVKDLILSLTGEELKPRK